MHKLLKVLISARQHASDKEVHKLINSGIPQYFLSKEDSSICLSWK